MRERKNQDFIESYLKYTSYHEASKRIHTWVALSILAGACERRIWYKRAFNKLFLNLYTIIVGQSGLVKKSTSTGIGIDLLKEVHGINMVSERCTPQAFVTWMSGAVKTFKHDGKDVKQSPLFAYASELKIFLQEIFASMMEIYTTFYDGQPHDSSKPWVYNTLGGGEVKIYGPCLNLLGASTPAWLQKSISAINMEGGFSSRCVFVVEIEGPENPIAWPEAPDDLESMKEDLISDLRSIYDLSGPITPDSDAKDAYEKWYVHHMKKVVPRNEDARFSGYLGRKGDQILKIAALKSISRSHDLVLRREDVLWAIATIEDLEPNMKLLFQSYVDRSVLSPIVVTDKEALIKDIILYLKTVTIADVSELRVNLSNKHSVGDFVDIITDMVACGALEQKTTNHPRTDKPMRTLEIKDLTRLSEIADKYEFIPERIYQSQ